MRSPATVGRLLILASADLSERIARVLARLPAPAAHVQVVPNLDALRSTLKEAAGAMAIVEDDGRAPAVLGQIQQVTPELPVVVIARATAKEPASAVQAAVAAMRAGAREYLLAEDLDRLPEVVVREFVTARGAPQTLVPAPDWATEAPCATESPPAGADLRLREVLDHAQELLYRLDLRTRRWDYIGKAAETLTGFTSDELLAMPFAETLARVHPEDVPTLKERSLALLADRTAEPRSEVTYRWRTRAGEWRWFGTTQTVIRDAEGANVAIVGANRDVTRRIESERAMQRHAQRRDRVVALTPALLAENTLDGLLVRVVEAARELTDTRMGALGYGYHSNEQAVGYASAGADLAPRPLTGASISRHGGVYLDLFGQLPTLRLTPEDLQGHVSLEGLPADHLPLRGLLGARLTDAGGEMDGLLMVSDKVTGEFDADDEAMLSQLAAIASLSLQQIAARREAERRAAELDAAFEALTDGIIIHDAQGAVVRVNRAVLQTLGTDPAGTALETLAQALDVRKPDGSPLPPNELPVWRALNGETVRNQWLTVPDTEGQVRHLLASGAPLCVGGQRAGAVTVWHDMTAVRRRADEHRDLRTLLETLVEALPVGVAVLRAPDYVYELTNPAFEHMPGASDGPLVGRKLREAFPMAADQGILALLDEVVASGRISGVRERRFSMGPGGDETYWDVDHVPLRESDGSIRRVLVLIREVTAQVLQREALEAERATLKAVLDHAPEAVVVADALGRVTYANAIAEAYYPSTVPYERELASYDHVGVCYLDGSPVPGKDLPLTRAALAGETPRDVQLTMLNAEGRQRRILVNAAPIDGPQGERYGAVAMFRDVTEQALADQALRTSEARYRSLFENLNEAFALFEPVEDVAGRLCDLRYLEVNPVIEAQTGRSREEILGHTMNELWGHLNPQFVETAERVLHSGEPEYFTIYGTAPGLYLDCRLFRPAEGQCAVLYTDVSDRVLAEEALRRERDFASAVLDTAGAVVLVLDREGHIIRLNRTGEALTGYTSAEVNGRSVEMLLPPDEHERVLQVLAELQQGQVPQSYAENHWVMRDGSRRLLAWDNAILRDDRGEAEYVIAVGIDVTEERAAQHVLERQLANLGALYEASQALLGQPDECHVLQRVCQLAVERFGLRMAWVGLVEQGILVPSAVAGHDEGYASRLRFALDAPDRRELPVSRALSSGRIVVVSDIATEPTFEPNWRPEALARGYRSLVALPFRIGDSLLGALTVYATEPVAFDDERLHTLQSLANLAASGIERARLYAQVQRHAEQLEETVARRTALLRQSEARFRTVFQNAEVGIGLVDRRGHIQVANPTLEALLGAETGTLNNCLLTDFAAPADDAAALLARYRSRATGPPGEPLRREIRFQRVDGALRWGRVVLSFVGGHSGFAIVMLEDTTDEREARQALITAERSLVTAQLSLAFAHEIKNPLQGVLGCLSLLEEELDDSTPRVREYLALAKDEMWRVDRIVSRLRDLRPSTSSDEPVPVLLVPVLEEVLLLTNRVCQQQGVNAALELPLELPQVIGRPDQLRQLFLNLVLNAIEAMPQGGALAVRAIPTSSPPGARVEISDTGVGIPAEQLSRIFSVMYSTKERGTGLGLFVCQDIVRTHRGRIEVTSEVGVGSTLSVWLPEGSR